MRTTLAALSIIMAMTLFGILTYLIISHQEYINVRDACVRSGGLYWSEPGREECLKH